MEQRKNIFAAGAALLWRRQRVLWWLWLANLAIGVLATAAVRAQLRVLDGSVVARDELYREMNYFRLTEAFARPEGLPNAFYGGSYVLILAYFVLLVFAMGGVLEAFCYDRPLQFAEFLRASAQFFWRMVRLLIAFALLMLPLAFAQNRLGDLSDWIGARSDREQLGFWITVALTLVLALVALLVRVWVDVAQVDAVAHDESAVRRSLARTRTMLRGSFLRVYAAVIAIQLLFIAITAGLFYLWLKVPHEWVGVTFALGQLGVLLGLAFRLWQKAVAAAWHEQSVAAEYVPPIVVAPEPVMPESPVLP